MPRYGLDQLPMTALIETLLQWAQRLDDAQKMHDWHQVEHTRSNLLHIAGILKKLEELPRPGESSSA